MIPTLNWRELQVLATDLGRRAEGRFVDRIFVPARPEMPSGYVKSEWAIRLTSRNDEVTLIFSVRPQRAYLATSAARTTAVAGHATRSPFDLAISKHLKGARLLEVQPLKRERVVVLWLQEPGRGPEDRLGLVLFLIPAMPEALLVRPVESERWEILARSRTIRNPTDQGESKWFIPPNGSQAPESPPLREELVRDSSKFGSIIEEALRGEAFELRLRNAERSLKELSKQTRSRIRQSTQAARSADEEPDWHRYGRLLKGVLGAPPAIVDGKRTVIDYESGESVEIPCDTGLSASAQVERFFSLARRKARRRDEALDRKATFESNLQRFEALLQAAPKALDFAALAVIEAAAGTAPVPATRDALVQAKSAKKARHAWLGRSYRSEEGLAIWVGRKRDENLELTFKHTRGNDLWMHVKGKPGAHVVIPLPSGKSASLETLLDAANLAIFYSGGEAWGKTEVDYTFKKYVKRIKDSTEASYTNNKTLIVQPDPKRLKRLLGATPEGEGR